MQLPLTFHPDFETSKRIFESSGLHYYEFHFDNTFTRIGHRIICKVLCIGNADGHDWIYLITPDGNIYQCSQMSCFSDIQKGEIAKAWGAEAERIHWERVQNYYSSSRKKQKSHGNTHIQK
jgi:radical SAM protein with 4Fe4S-binding SPASM domain